MIVAKFSQTDRLYHRATHKVTLDYADVAALGASTTGTIAILPSSGTFPAGIRAMMVAVNLITAFDASDASINSLLIEVGDGGDTDRLLTQTELASDGTEVLFKASAASTQPYAYEAADTIDAKFTVAGGGTPTLAEITSGKVEIYLWIDDLNILENVGGPLSTT